MLKAASWSHRSSKFVRLIVLCTLVFHTAQHCVSAQRQSRQVAAPTDSAPEGGAAPAEHTAAQPAKTKSAAPKSGGKLSPGRLAAYNNYDDYTLYTKVGRAQAHLQLRHSLSGML